MRFVTVRDLRNTPGTVWSALDKDDLVLTSNGDPIAVLVRVDGENLDDTLAAVRRARASQAVSRLRQQAAESGAAGLTEDEIEQEISAARQDRRRG